jgi:hypothetical protein
LPPLDAPTQEDLDRSHLLCGLGTRIEVAHRELQGTWLHLQCRERQLLAAMRVIQKLRQQIGKEMLAHQTAEKCAIGLQQQLAQIRDATFTTVGCWECPNAIQAAQTIAALKADNAQKDARIAELEGGKK